MFFLVTSQEHLPYYECVVIWVEDAEDIARLQDTGKKLKKMKHFLKLQLKNSQEKAGVLDFRLWATNMKIWRSF